LKFEQFILEERTKAYNKGRDEERRLNAALAAALASEGREGEIAGAMADPRVRDRLLEELGIE
jgi:hypothetical protein